MTTDRARLRDHLDTAAAYGRPLDDLSVVRGTLHVVLTGPDGEVKLDEIVDNLVTQVGDQWYAERAAGVGSLGAVTGMQLGTGATATSKTGAGAAIGTLAAASLVALSGAPASSLNGSARRITYSASWAAGVATVNGLAEVALVTQAVGTQTAAPAAATIARALLTPTVNKGALDTLAVTWHHDLAGT